MKRIIFAAVACLLAGAPARADCDHFKWSVARELGWFKASPAALPAEGGSAAPGAGYELTLAKDVKLPIPPERAPGKDTSAAVVTVPKLDAGAYQITLSAEAWIDVGQNGALVKSSAFSGQRDCPGVRKSVRFTLAAGPTTIEISNAGADKIMLAIAPAQ
jgi:hypothetical protein